MHTAFNVNASDLDENFLEGLKTMFKNKRITIIVEEEQGDETEYLLSSEKNRKILEESLKNVEEGKTTEVDIDQYLREE